MRVQCPHCEKTVTLDNSKAEQPTPCPACGNIFTAPALLNALPDEPPAAPPAPPTPAPTVAPPPAAVAPPAAVPVAAQESPSGSEPICRVTLNRRVIHWVGPVAVILLFLLSFFTWVAASPGGIPVYTQSAWGVMTGGFSTDITGEEVFGMEKSLNDSGSFSFWMFLFLMLLLPTVIVAVGELFQQYVTVPVPDVINALWPRRLPALTIASLLLFALLGWQMLSGMGLESAVARHAEGKFPPPTEKKASPVGDEGKDATWQAPAAENLKQRAVRELKRGEEMSRLGVRRTNWLCLAFWATVIASAGFLLEMWLERRGPKDPVIEMR